MMRVKINNFKNFNTSNGDYFSRSHYFIGKVQIKKLRQENITFRKNIDNANSNLYFNLRLFQICELQARLEGLQHVHATDARQYATKLSDFEQGKFT